MRYNVNQKGKNATRRVTDATVCDVFPVQGHANALSPARKAKGMQSLSLQDIGSDGFSGVPWGEDGFSAEF